ncbi:uncharacterized protein LOC131024976 isoform X3 [Salvia miltiorrhiza]|uniref:uncharacterized protein LOC131024976 isoform X3 n=1 Tax=Salvia miltiorrhiza TaxID=226208 RepID=UPI0025AB7C2A|nr:uncharacterized protein LOC131024976 isoform X3 [Salvia miltiorrhiza]
MFKGSQIRLEETWQEFIIFGTLQMPIRLYHHWRKQRKSSSSVVVTLAWKLQQQQLVGNSIPLNSNCFLNLQEASRLLTLQSFGKLLQ